MAKAFSIIALIIAICMLLIFGLDVAIGVPFRKVSTWMDGGFIFCGVVLAYLSFRTFREQR